ncbi:MAG: S-layer homology domain-containing protein [Aminipila sp.]
MNGVGKYDPTGTVTLGQFLAISTRLVAEDKIVKGDYSHWATANYNAAIEANLIRSSDFEGSPLALNANLSREDMAYILVNIAKANGEDLKIKDGIQNNIKDYNSISPNRQNVVLQAYSNGLLAGDTQGKFNPHQVLNRAEVAAVFCRVMNYSARPEVKVNQPSTETAFTGYVSDEGATKGMLLSKYSRQYDLEALQGVRTGSDSKGVYVTFTAPQLPNEL